MGENEIQLASVVKTALRLPPKCELRFWRLEGTEVSRYGEALLRRKKRAPHSKIILGSSSVARRKVLAEMGYDFTIMSADIDEKSIRKEKPEELVMALAEAKIILGSSSVARRKVLAEMGYDFTIMSADIDEKSIRKEKPEELVMALAEAKLTWTKDKQVKAHGCCLLLSEKLKMPDCTVFDGESD
ncbi:hypothetical protein TEA_020508 [Camellia sinensis var. sinensis]|uniref:Maf-like protein n=1 Tax=Camellia sinensis var. sinensis TaxID=542762 RepID=A0A4S4CY00_CAMSN|nr:hypothetical protein TEA_020508 [Camellia sinensis var. sinensis]